MKGPGDRLRHDVRRNWECPACRRRLKTAGTIVHLLCTCGAKETPPREYWMLLLEETGPKKGAATQTEETPL
jgi:hypothetical protein